MLKYTLLLLLLPSVIAAQQNIPVTPVESKDYLDLINKDSADKKDSAITGAYNSLRNSNLIIKGKFYNTGFQKIEIKDNYLKVYPHKTTHLSFGGFFNSTVEIKKANLLPALQKQYVQGRSNAGLQWNGPETGELFSFGPDINFLEFDGSDYQYDQNGRLVPQGSGSGVKKATPYDNSILRTATLFSQSLNIQANHSVNGKTDWTASVKLGHTNENTLIKNNRNSSKNISASLQTIIKSISIAGAYSHLQDRLSNSNRNGFLNRVYQNALLTPVSFDNSQGTMMGSIQRSYSPYADNPYFLLEDNGNYYLQSHHNGSLSVESKQKKLKYKLLQSFNHSHENSVEAYKPGTSYFPGGISTSRSKKDFVYFLKANPTLDINYGGSSKFESLASLNYIFTSAKSDIQYSTNPAVYAYRRSSHDFALSYNAIYNGHAIRIGAEIGNKFYLSNSSTKTRFFLPATGGFVSLTNVLENLDIKVSSSLIHFDNESPLDRSMSHANLLQYSTAQSYTYFPLTEVNSFDQLQPIHHREWSGKAEVRIGYKIALLGEVFIKKTFNDVYPVYENDQLVLRNIADHRNTGVELQLVLASELFRSRQQVGTPKLYFSNTISFLAWQNKVTDVRDGYDFTPLAGFSNIHKAIVKGQAFGAIVGNSFRRDAAGNMIIGADGFPLADNQLKVIGNPIPDFIMKWNNGLSWKRFTMNIDWEWRKGGEVWNGTQAMLDYYGRSAQTASLRNISNYIFPGVLENGHPNNTVVSFYDPSRPVTENRWVRYGPGGIAEDYIQKADQIRLQSVSLAYKLYFKKYIQSVTLSTYINNIILWSAYKGADPGTRLLYDQPNTSGLDFFNLPATRTYGLLASIQF